METYKLSCLRSDIDYCLMDTKTPLDFALGAYLKPSAGKLIDSGATATEMIALKSSAAADTVVEYLKK